MRARRSSRDDEKGNKRQTFSFFRLHDFVECRDGGGSRGKEGQLIVNFSFLSLFCVFFVVAAYFITRACTSCVVCVLDVGPCWT